MSYTPIPIDAFSVSAKGISWEHSVIHLGETFRYSDSITLGSGASQDYWIQTPAAGKRMHLTFQGDGVAITSFFLFEGTDRAGTTVQPIYNAFRDSVTASQATIKKGTSGGTTDGTLIQTYASGAGAIVSRASSNEEHRNEWILKLNTAYIFRVTSGTAANLCNVLFDWYEHVSGT